MEQRTETPRGTSLVCSLAEMMAMEMVLLMESDWVEPTEMHSEQLMESQMEMSSVCLMDDSMDMQLGLSLVPLTAVSREIQMVLMTGTGLVHLME